MHPGRQYIIKLATDSGNVTISDLSHVVDINSNKQLAGKRLEINEVGFCKLKVDRDIAFDSFAIINRPGAHLNRPIFECYGWCRNDQIRLAKGEKC